MIYTRHAYRSVVLGFTLIEIVIVCALLAILQSVAAASYFEYIERVNISTAIRDIRDIEDRLLLYFLESGEYPATLEEIGADMLDPWGNPYHYLNISLQNGNGKLRKDKNLVPVNSDYDIYSAGKDGLSVGPLTAPQSHDDIIRANNGAYYGLAEKF